MDHSPLFEVPTSQHHPSEKAPVLSNGSSHAYTRATLRKTNAPSCNLCRKRKTKCDRRDPCSHCVRVGAVCVSPAPSRAPRGRQGGRRKNDTELLERIAKLENLVNCIEGETIGAGQAVPAPVNGRPPPDAIAGFIHDPRQERDELSGRTFTSQSTKSGSKEEKVGMERYLGVNLWMTLCDEINGMREVLNQPSDDEDDDSDLTASGGSPGRAQTPQSGYVICPPHMLPNAETALKHPTPSQRRTLCELFMTNVDPALKMLHAPSLRRFFIDESRVLDCSPGPNGWDALQFAIYYTATTSLTNGQCLQRLGEERDILLPRFRHGTELALARADFVNTEDISTLQALVLYLVAVRSNENSRRMWTLLSLAVRIAYALGLHRESNGGPNTSRHKPFNREMRRRLWWQILMIDRQASIDRGSEPMVSLKSFNTQMPLHVNDEDLIPDDPREVSPRDGYTDNTLSMICHEVFDLHRRLNYMAADELEHQQESSDDPWAQRRAWVIDGQQRVEEKYLRHCNSALPTQRYTVMVADIIIAVLWLFIYRPLQRHCNKHTAGKVSHAAVLHLSVQVMEKTLQFATDDSCAHFRWISTTWVQWHSLAVMIAELCVQTEGPTVERAWAIVHAAFEETRRVVADSEKGRLWRPMKKLMNKAQAVRMKHLEGVAAAAGFPTGRGASRSNIQPFSYVQTQLPIVNGVAMEVEPAPGTGLLSETAGILQQSADRGYATTIDWDQWLDTGKSNAMENSTEMNQMSWTNWETFVDDFQANGTLWLGQQDGTMPPASNTW